MRTIPQSIQNALLSKSLPIKKKILMYRRFWNEQNNSYELESTPVDITHLLHESGNVKMALDTDEVDKWDASNVTFTFKNTLNCFKEGLAGGLFENSVLWGSKFVYLVKNADKNAPNDSVAVFTGYVYSSPAFKDNGNFISLTVTSSLDALEYFSAEDFCYTKTDEEASLITSQNNSDQGKEYATSEAGVGYVDKVKYGTSLAESVELSLQTDYTVSNLNEYASPAIIKLNVPAESGAKVWVSYRYWHQNMEVDAVVNALLDIAGIEQRYVERAAFVVENSAVEYVRPYYLLFEPSQNNTYTRQISPFLSQAGVANTLVDFHRLNYKATESSTHNYNCCLPTKNSYFHLGQAENRYIFAPSQSYSEGNVDYVADDGTGLRFKYSGASGGTKSISVQPILDYENSVFGEAVYSASARAFIGFDFNEEGLLSVFTCSCSAIGYLSDDGPVTKTTTQYTYTGGDFTRIIANFSNVAHDRGNWVFFINEFGWRHQKVSDAECPGNTYNAAFRAAVFNGVAPFIFQHPAVIFEGSFGENGTKWRQVTGVLSGNGSLSIQKSTDGETYSTVQAISTPYNLAAYPEFIRVKYQVNGGYDVLYLSNFTVSKYITSANLQLINLTGLTVGAAIVQLAKIVSYEIGFNQNGLFFFRSRGGTYTDVEITPHELISCENNAADIDSLVNRVNVEFGNFKTTIDDISEGKPRPNTIDTYGVHEKSISSDNFIPADNVDISSAVARANYEALSTPGYTVQIECLPKLELELGDKIRVSSKNAQLADPNWSDHTKFEQLPIWKRVFKIIGIELSVDKRKMVLNLKDVTTSADEPEETMYEFVYDFPINLGAKK